MYLHEIVYVALLRERVMYTQIFVFMGDQWGVLERRLDRNETSMPPSEHA